MKPTLMLIGLGHLGAAVLELLAREPILGRIVACCRDAGRGIARCNLARLGAAVQGLEPRIDFLPLDLDRTDATAESIRSEAPDIILSTASMQTWWLADLLPPDAAAAIRSAGFGIWLPVHLAPTLKLMQAVKASGFSGATLTAPYPDVVNCVLARRELAPTCGVGNVDEMAVKVRLLACQRLRVAPERVTVLLVAHHALEPTVFGKPRQEIPPYYLRVELDGQDVTEDLDASALLLSPYPLPAGPAWASLTAASTARLIRGLLSPGATALHAPAPGGLPGGYPILAASGRVRRAPIPGLPPEEAVAINERSHRFDGIDRIETDGTTVFSGPSTETMRRELGYDCQRLPPDEAQDRGAELVARFRDYAARHGVRLERRP